MPNTIVNSEIKRELVEAMREEPRIVYREIADELGKAHSTVARWFMNPTEKQARLVRLAIASIRSRQSRSRRKRGAKNE